MALSLPALPYAHNALEPHIDAQTMEIHHGKHHQAYVDNLNKAIEGTDAADLSLEELVKTFQNILLRYVTTAVAISITLYSGLY